MSGNNPLEAVLALVAPDTNVVVAASIMENIGEIGTVKHEFYDESIELFGTLQRIGGVYLVPSVEAESYLVLSRAVKDAYAKKIRSEKAAERYADMYSIVASSYIKMARLTSRMKRAHVDEDAVRSNMRKVAEMSRHLEGVYRNKYSTADKRKKVAIERSGYAPRGPRWKKGIQSEVLRMYRIQVDCESAQLRRFMRHPNTADQRILAEVITLRDSLGRGSPPAMIASLDTGFFSPHYYRGGKSDIVTEEIRRRFRISCHRPREIIMMARQDA